MESCRSLSILWLPGNKNMILTNIVQVITPTRKAMRQAFIFFVLFSFFFYSLMPHAHACPYFLGVTMVRWHNYLIYYVTGEIWILSGAHQMEPPSPLISWVNPFSSRFINRTASFPRKVSYFRESRVSPWKNKIGWSRTQKPVLRPFSFFPLRPFLQFFSRWDLGIMK